MKNTLLASAAIAFALWLSAGQALAKCDLVALAELPIEMNGARATTAATINGADARLFIDTGSFFTELTPSGATRLGLRMEPLPPRMRVVGVTGTAETRMTHVRDMRLSNADLGPTDLLVGEHDLGPADGLVGQNVFGSYDMEYDFANGVMRLYQPKGCEQDNLAYWRGGAAAPTLKIEPLSRYENAIEGEVVINGVRMRAHFDTGAGRTVLTLHAAQRIGISPTSPGVVAIGVSSGTGRKLARAWIAPISSFEIGDERVTDTRLEVADFDLGSEDLLVGADFFLSHRVLVSKTQDKLYFTYNGGPVFTLGDGARVAVAGVAVTPPATPSIVGDPDQPTDAAGFAARAAAALARGGFVKAIADYTRAIELAPDVAEYYRGRGQGELLGRQPLRAADDFNAALKLKPDDAKTLLALGGLKLVNHDVAGARSDFASALAADPSTRLAVANAYGSAGLYKDALDNYDAWIASHPRNEDAAAAYSGRCVMRGISGQDIDKGLADCNQALDLVPGTPAALLGRGLVRLRRGEYDKAIADEDAVIKVQPKAAWALYARGVAKVRKGQAADGQADLAAAAAIAPQLAARAKANGLSPDS
jgi:tetratricopeptide (TPR) repeat protein/predicted aspartyl protease